MTRWWQSDGPSVRRDRDLAEQLPEVAGLCCLANGAPADVSGISAAPPVAETDARREAIERARERILALPDRR
jgi:hypothetical protein